MSEVNVLSFHKYYKIFLFHSCEGARNASGMLMRHSQSMKYAKVNFFIVTSIIHTLARDKGCMQAKHPVG